MSDKLSLQAETPLAGPAVPPTQWRRYIQLGAMIVALLVIAVFFTLMTDGAYLTPRNVSNLLRQTAITGILAIGMTFVIVSAEIDLSVGSMMGLLGGMAAIMDVWWHWPLPLTIVVTLLSGAVLGAWNGWWVAFRMVPSFIVTLAGMLAFRGILIGITQGETVAPTSAAMGIIGQSYLPNLASLGVFALAAVTVLALRLRYRRAREAAGLALVSAGKDVGSVALWLVLLLVAILMLNLYRGVPAPVMILLGLMVAGAWIAKRTLFGRHVYAVGGNTEASHLSGVHVPAVKLGVFTLNGLLVAVAALILSSRLGAGSPSAGSFAELDAIAACVIGGTSLAGGVGSVYRAVLGALIMSSLDNGMSMMDVPTFWQYIVKGAILLLAVWLDSATRQRR